LNCDMVTLNLCAYFGAASKESSVGVPGRGGQNQGDEDIGGNGQDYVDAVGNRDRKRSSNTCGRLAPLNVISAQGGLVNPWLDCRNWKDHDILHNKCKRLAILLLCTHMQVEFSQLRLTYTIGPTSTRLNVDTQYTCRIHSSLRSYF
jgi:hypothetical protein